MRDVRLPAGFRLERLSRAHRRPKFCSGEAQVDDWLHTRALQNQEKRLAVTRVLLDDNAAIAGFYTLAMGHVDFADLPADLARRLPRRTLPIAVLAWLGVARDRQGRGLGRLLLALALRDALGAGRTFAFVAVVLDCVNDTAKRFYHRWGFRELPGHPHRLFMSVAELEALMAAE